MPWARARARRGGFRGSLPAALRASPEGHGSALMALEASAEVSSPHCARCPRTWQPADDVGGFRGSLRAPERPARSRRVCEASCRRARPIATCSPDEVPKASPVRSVVAHGRRRRCRDPPEAPPRSTGRFGGATKTPSPISPGASALVSAAPLANLSSIRPHSGGEVPGASEACEVLIGDWPRSREVSTCVHRAIPVARELLITRGRCDPARSCRLDAPKNSDRQASGRLEDLKIAIG
jgi:hypothetical protein